jgi:hypothetical protein
MVEELRRRRFRVERIVANRVETGAVDEQLPSADEVAPHVAIGDAALVAGALDGIRAAHDRRAAAVARHARQVEILGRTGADVAVVVDAGTDGGTGALGAIAAAMPRG